MTAKPIPIGGPYFEDFSLGQVIDDAPAMTLTSGLAALHQAISGDRLRLALDHDLSTATTGDDRPLAHPLMVVNLAIGQTTWVSQRVRGNLFYRGLVHLKPVFIGDSLRTRSTVVGLRQNKPRPGRDATGMVALEIDVTNQVGDTVLHFWRCPMIPCRDAKAETGFTDSFDHIPETLDIDEVAKTVPATWRLDHFKAQCPGRHFAGLKPGTVYAIEARDRITSAPEMARATLNMAMTHYDGAQGAYGEQLVFGGHTISLAAAQASRALPNLVTILAWNGCDHTGPVFEGDMLSTELAIEGLHPLAGGKSGPGLVELRARVTAERGQSAVRAGFEAGGRNDVLDWRFIALMA